MSWRLRSQAGLRGETFCARFERERSMVEVEGDCSLGSNSFARSARLRPARTISISLRAAPAGTGNGCSTSRTPSLHSLKVSTKLRQLRLDPRAYRAYERHQVAEMILDDISNDRGVDLRIAVDEHIAETGHVLQAGAEIRCDPARRGEQVEEFAVRANYAVGRQDIWDRGGLG